MKSISGNMDTIASKSKFQKKEKIYPSTVIKGDAVENSTFVFDQEFAKNSKIKKNKQTALAVTNPLSAYLLKASSLILSAKRTNNYRRYCRIRCQ